MTALFAVTLAVGAGAIIVGYYGWKGYGWARVAGFVALGVGLLFHDRESEGVFLELAVVLDPEVGRKQVELQEDLVLEFVEGQRLDGLDGCVCHSFILLLS